MIVRERGLDIPRGKLYSRSCWDSVYHNGTNHKWSREEHIGFWAGNFRNRGDANVNVLGMKSRGGV
jgi:hypothetical protein